MKLSLKRYGAFKQGNVASVCSVDVDSRLRAFLSELFSCQKAADVPPIDSSGESSTLGS